MIFLLLHHISSQLHPYKKKCNINAEILLPSKTSGAIQAALPLLLVMCVWISQAVPKSQIFRTVPPATKSKLSNKKTNKQKDIKIVE